MQIEHAAGSGSVDGIAGTWGTRSQMISIAAAINPPATMNAAPSKPLRVPQASDCAASNGPAIAATLFMLPIPPWSAPCRLASTIRDRMPLSEGQMSHYKGSADDRCLAQRQSLLGDRGYDTDWFRDALARRGIAASIPPKANRQVPIFHDAALYRQRHKIKICSTGSRTGAASTPDTIALPTPSCLPSASLQPSSSGSINEMGWLPPSLTASQCAKNVVLSATERKGRQP